MSLRSGIQKGLIAGVTMVFTAATGMVAVFNNKVLIDPFLTMGYLVLFAIPFVVAFGATRKIRLEGVETEEPGVADVALGAVIGLVGGLLVAGFVAVINSTDITRIFPNMNAIMVREMTFGQALGTGLVILTGGSVVMGVLGGAVRLLNERVSRAFFLGVVWTLAVSFLELVISDIFDFFPSLTDFLYANTGGLNPVAALLVFLLGTFLSWRFAGRGDALRRTFVATTTRGRSKPTTVAIIVVGLGIVFLPMVVGGVVNELLINVALFMLMGLGLNIVVGYAGLLDLGYVAFFAVGAYTVAVLTAATSPTWRPEFGWWTALAVSIVFAIIAGLMVGTPVIRMRGDYLAIVTLGFGEIVRILLLSDWLKPFFGGAQGIRAIPGINFLGHDISGVDPELFVYFAMFFVAIAVWVSYRLQNARIGRAWAALREDEDVAEATGVGTVRAKLLAFVSGAVLASFAGALVSAKVGTVFTNSFDVLVSIIILVVVIVGGMGSIPGVMAGALVLIGVLGGPRSPGLLAEFSEYKLLIYGAILVFMMLKRPEGLIPSSRRSRELHHEELSQDAWLDKAGKFTGEDGETAEGAPA